MIAHPPLACSWLGCCERALADNNNKSALSQGHGQPSGRAHGAGIGFWFGLCDRGLPGGCGLFRSPRSWRCAGVSRRLRDVIPDGSGWLRAVWARLEHGANLRKPPSVVNGATGGDRTRIHQARRRGAPVLFHLSYGSGVCHVPMPRLQVAALAVVILSYAYVRQ
jgi:hypothetical protein